MLGDGHIALINGLYIYIESHAIDEKDYLFWKYEILKNLCKSQPKLYSGGEKQFGDKIFIVNDSYRINTRGVDELGEIKNLSRIEKINLLDELGVCTHFLDDGSRSIDGYWHICFGDWQINENKYYIQKLKEKFDIELRLTKDTRYADATKKSSTILDQLILRNIPNDLDIIHKKILRNG